MQRQANFPGRVTLVGAGPGDPDLLTVKACRMIKEAQFIMYDNLVSEEIRALFPQDATTVFVGKAKGKHSATQQDINDLLLNAALSGKNVCRVKGGDSFVFGRGGEEMLMLAKQGIEVDVIPGITAASGCTSYANIPLTHRGLAQGCTFITAHADKTLDINWDALAQLNQTLVFYMGLSKTDMLMEKLISGGMSEETPVAFIENGCTPKQRVHIGKLNQLSTLKQQYQIQSPALIVVGEVVSIAEQMHWLTQLSHRQIQPSPLPQHDTKQLLQLTA
ncbi:uroporphyrinogen-III C-methyltransferase [Vibrio ezurae]|uniref:uroporphyrinogen-III C-methyltransferase n=1 Tax=Vibrio ezurae NBRC 102218 TaxID=1219080 RepID=U3CG32_9VIBR|nr:uroporphyrinogen-III C-methyltransferase [Vibrio ezurae]GAD80184.1 uroporphyrin-III C-methyltransferase [Vibrio ezurae NBRC 102218]